MEINNIIPWLALMFGYYKFNQTLKQKNYELRQHEVESVNKIYKEIILKERLNRNNKMLDSMRNLLANLEGFSYAIGEKLSYEETIDEFLDKAKTKKENIESEIDFISEVSDKNEKLGDKLQEYIKNIEYEFDFLYLLYYRKYHKKFERIDKNINSYIYKGYNLKVINKEFRKYYEKQMESIEGDLRELFQSIMEDDWKDIDEKTKLLLDEPDD